ncbi:MAG: hypothetical protein ACD_52C00081G0002 [uncultured bacterium]|nr:MAG: hypothetical protein ACD_52C00081G0002 [uncultured bacterium]
MIRLGKKYFYGDELSELTIIQADAFTWVKHQSDTYDLILVDIFLGEITPKLTEEPEFLQDIQAILATPGKVIFNRLFYDHHREAAQHFVHKVEKKFGEIALVRAWSNLLIVASNKTRKQSKLALKG